MAVTRISELTPITTPNGGDLFIVNDGPTTNSVTYDNLYNTVKTQLEGDSLAFTGSSFEINSALTLDGVITVNGDITFIGEVGGIDIDELGDVDTTTQAPTVNQVLMWTSNNRWEPRTVSPTGGADVTSVNTQTGDVVLDADDIDDTTTDHKFATSAELTLVGTALQPGDIGVTIQAYDASNITSGSNISLLNNDANFITSAGAPIQTVNTQTGAVVLDADDIDDTSTTHKFATSTQLGLAETAVQPTDSINALADVDTVTTAPEVGQVVVWDGSNWIPGDIGRTEWEVTNNSTASYRFGGVGFSGLEDNPTIYVSRGVKYNFNVVNGGHPFQIQSTSGLGGTVYNDGITNNAAAGDTLVWEVRMDAPGTLYYQCTVHAAMNGTITVR